MGLLANGRVNMVITNYAIRYTYHSNPSKDGLITYGEVNLPEGIIKDGKVENKPAFVEIINKLVHENKWKRKKLFFAVPDDTVVIRNIQIPASLTKQEAKEYVHTQLGKRIYLPFSNPSIAMDFLGQDDEMQHVLLYAYPKEKLAAFEDVFDKAGLKVHAADLTSLSAYRYYYKLIQDHRAHVLLIYWNQDCLVLTIFQNDKAIFTRYIKIDQQRLSVDEAETAQLMEDYIVEINRIIDFYRYSITNGEWEINQLLLTGDYPLLQEVKKRLSDRLSIPIHSFENEELGTKYTDVLGLALKSES